MEIDIEKMTAYERYKLMASLIAPRPIALITTLSATGVINAAPFSMFNMVGEDPPMIMVSMNAREDGTLKDTVINIIRSGEFVVHMTDEVMAKKMHLCSAPLGSDVSELPYAQLNSTPSQCVAPPRVAEAPVALECTLFETITTASRYIFLGQVRWLHVRDGLVDLEVCRVNLSDYFPVGRFGGDLYTTTRERFAIDSLP
jgi:flavin reductase (DIM6/NTAB) family NADH-FMN oxidoreductase RutF